MSQDTFNKFLTISLFLFFVIVYLLSWLLQKPIDLINIVVFLIPGFVHAVHLFTHMSVTIATISKEKEIELTKIKNDKINE